MPLLTGSFVIPQEQSQILLTRSRKDSYVLQNGTRVPVSGSGAIVPVFTDDIGGGWVNEATSKPVNEAAVTNKQMVIRKWSTIVPVSEETVTDVDQRINILAEIAENAQGGFARAVDLMAATGGGFSGQSYLDQTTKSVKLGTATKANGGIYGDFNAGLRALVGDASMSRTYTGALLDTVVEPDINDAVDLQGRPIYVDTPVNAETNTITRFGRLLGRPTGFVQQLAHGTGTTRVVGYMGNWSRVFYGLVGDVRVDYSNQASYVLGGATKSAFQDNLVLVRVEARVGVLVADPEDFVKIYGVGTSPLS
jgi:HK97 family phage major capsid protein